MQHDLWTYACGLYARPGMEAACLAAQEAGSDVCLALCALWLEQRQVRWSADRSRALNDIALPWTRTVIAPLRRLRQQWRDAAQGDATLGRLRHSIKELELDAEQALLQRLQAVGEAWPGDAIAQPCWLDYAVADPESRRALRTAAGLP